MTDKQLLELAAKAAGLTIVGSIPSILHDDDWLETTSDGPDMFWNPLTDDGDALRLAVKLKISPIQIIDEPICAAYWTDVMCCNQSHGDDPYAATRRAIVRAAAEIGKGMK